MSPVSTSDSNLRYLDTLKVDVASLHNKAKNRIANGLFDDFVLLAWF